MLHHSRYTREREIAVTRLADATIVVSSAERDILHEAAPGAPVFTVPLIRKLEKPNVSVHGRTKIGFIGGYLHQPNVDAVNFFLDEIWPKVRAALPDATFVAFGADMPEEISKRTDPGFVPVGYVENLGGALRDVRVMVAPLRFGAGAKGKIVTSLAHGVPCVGTPIALEGMDLTAGENIFVGPDPDEFAKAIVNLVMDDRLWKNVSEQGLAFVRKRHSLDEGTILLQSILTEAGASHPSV
jgi:glycosyltransferase involved in cell wall biosynthesis